jgi:integrase/recombinase XerC
MPDKQNRTRRQFTPEFKRDAVELVRTTGMRREEATQLSVQDYDPRKVTFAIRHGKGNVGRVVGAAEWVRAPMERWLRVRGPEAGALFCGVRKHGSIDRGRRHVTPTGLHTALKRRLAAAGIEQDWTCHDFRRTLAGDLLDRGADISAVQKQLGHKQVTTTQRYDRRPLERLRQVAQLVPSPLDVAE